MAVLALTDAATSEEINTNPLLAGFGYAHQGSFLKWSDTALTYTLNAGDTNPEGEQSAPWLEALSLSIQRAHADIEAVSQLRFTEIADATNGTDGADIDYWAYSSPGDNVAGFSYGVAGSGVYMNMEYVYEPNSWTGDGLAYGGVNHRTVIHELLHNLGLGHPHDGYALFPGVTSAHDTGDFALNQNVYTVMSYNSVRQVDANGMPTTGYPFTYQTVDRSFGVLGTLDIAMLQVLYGANTDHATGNDVYMLPDENAPGTYYKAIWDAGGIDEFRYDGDADTTIDLRAATLDVADGMLAGGMLSTAHGVYGGLNIAHGTVIEIATSGAGDDILIGNAAENVLTGGAGIDVLVGGAGADTLVGGEGADTVEGGEGVDLLDLSQSADGVWVDFVLARGQDGDAEGDVYDGLEAIRGSERDDMLYGDDGDNYADGNGGDDVIHLARGNDTLMGAAGNDTLDGGAGDDSISGGQGDDWIRGGSGADVLEGGAGFDRVDYSASAVQVVIDLSAMQASGGDATGDVLSGFEAVGGSSYADVLTGDEAANTLDGGNGRDVLDGGGGDDLLIGGAGRDTFVFSSGEDTIYGGDDEDVFIVSLAVAGFAVTDHGAGNWDVERLQTGDVTHLEDVETLVFDDFVFS